MTIQSIITFYEPITSRIDAKETCKAWRVQPKFIMSMVEMLFSYITQLSAYKAQTIISSVRSEPLDLHVVCVRRVRTGPFLTEPNSHEPVLLPRTYIQYVLCWWLSVQYLYHCNFSSFGRCLILLQVDSSALLRLG